MKINHEHKLMEFYRILFGKLRNKIIRTDIKEREGYLILGTCGFGWRHYFRPLLKDEKGIAIIKNGIYQRDESKPLESFMQTRYYNFTFTYESLKKHQKELNKYLKPEERIKLRLWLKVADKYYKIYKIRKDKRDKWIIRLNEQFDKKADKIIEEGTEILKRYICLENL